MGFAFWLIIAVTGQAQTDTLWQIAGDTVVFIAPKSITTDRVKLSNRDFKRLPGGFDDPSRILIHFPGIAIANDQANGVVYHGLPAHMTQWRLNGLDIVNPNHLSNAGTLSDLSSPSAGGVNMYSGNVLDGFEFVAPSFTSKRSWSLAGIADLQTSTKRQNYLQLSVLGLEAGLHKKWQNNSHVFANYRYSFTGLLEDLGVSFGNEAIRFDDWVAGYSAKNKNFNTSFFFAYGSSTNKHNAQPKPLLTYKDGQNIYYHSKNITAQWLAGYQYLTGHELNVGVAYSKRSDDRKADGEIVLEDDTTVDVAETFGLSHQKYTAMAKLTTPGNWQLEARWMYDQLQYDKTIDTNAARSVADELYSTQLNVFKNISLGQHLKLKTELALMYQRQLNVLPALTLEYYQGPHTVSASLSRNVGGVLLNQAYALHSIVGMNYMLDYKITTRYLKTTVSGFYHDISRLPADTAEYNFLLAYDLSFDGKISSTGRGKSQGVSFMAELDAGKNWWLNVNHSWLNTLYKNSGSTNWNHAENDFGWMGNANVGKTIKLGHGQLSLSVSFHYRGGQFYYTAMPYPATQQYNLAPQNQFAPYLRWDARINYTRKKSMISLDIQNVTNRQNEGFARYGPTGPYIEYQLGLLPVISYKRSW
ncbi:MAG: hypothetical protein U0V54_12545 [Saprospiraceae bacterium]|nr:hypothetical protein [Saprospiraceae bacterium]